MNDKQTERKEISFSNRDIEIMRYIFIIGLIEPFDALELQTIARSSFNEVCFIIETLDSALYPENEENKKITFSRDIWTVVNNIIVTSIGGLPIVEKYESISPYSMEELKETQERVIKKIKSL